MTTFSEAFDNLENNRVSLTENGAKAWATTGSKVLNLFGTIGSARTRDISDMFMSALAEDENLALRALLWARDIRSGAGERSTFRKLLVTLETLNPVLAGKIMYKIPQLGRWDDLFTYQESQNRKDAFALYAEALKAGDGLAFKWAPREKSAKKDLAREFREFLGMSPRDYRKMLSAETRVVEQHMCAKEWNKINFSHVPSLAASRYQKAFRKNATVAYEAYLRELQKPESERDPSVKINVGAVYPYDVVKASGRGVAAAADAQWAALPNYIGDSKMLAMVDVSGSMTDPVGSNLTCMDVAISLGLYISDKTTSDFKGMYITFTNRADVVKTSGTLSQRIMQMRQRVGYSTNITSAFISLLKVAVDGRVSAENMPDYLVILSDMQFDSMEVKGKSATALEMARKEYEKAGYSLPKIIFWNLFARAAATSSNFPVKVDDTGTILVSGFSPTIMTSVLGANPEEFSPYNMMLKVLENPRYDF
jgi:hypothetical protein